MRRTVGLRRPTIRELPLAAGRYVLLLNSDTVVLDQAIAKTVAFADARPDAAVVGCRVLNADRTLQRTCSMYPSLPNLVLSSTYLYKILPRSRPPRPGAHDVVTMMALERWRWSPDVSC